MTIYSSHTYFAVIASVIAMVSLSACTPFKIDQYLECKHRDECDQPAFQYCDQNNFCVDEGSLCYWQLPDGQQVNRYTPSNSQVVLGLLAQRNFVSKEGQGWSAIVGIQSGFKAVDQANLSPAIIICNPASEDRQLALDTFANYGVQTIIGQPLEGEDVPSNIIYISMGLDTVDSLYQKDTLGTPRQGWFNLTPSKKQLHQAFEKISTLLLDKVTSSVIEAAEMSSFQEENFISILALKQQTDPPSFVEGLTWRLSPYEASNFRTLIVYFGSFFNIDQSVNDFLKSDSPLQLYVTIEPIEQSTLNAIVESATSQTTALSTRIPFHLLSIMWDLSKVRDPSIEFWPTILQYTVAFGQYPHLYAEEAEATSLRTMYNQAVQYAQAIDPDIKLPSPYFGLAFDIGVLSALVSRLTTANVTPHLVIETLTQVESNSPRVTMVGENLVQAFSDTDNDEGTWVLKPVQLHGLSGLISTNSDHRLAPLMLCSNNGQQVTATPFSKLMPPTILEPELGITDYFSIDINICEP